MICAIIRTLRYKLYAKEAITDRGQVRRNLYEFISK